METVFYTLQQFMTFSKGVTYVLMGLALVAFIGFGRFLFASDEEKKKTIT